MVSEFEYIDIDDLEEYMIQTFDSVDARYDDDAVNAKISQAERIINEKAGQSFTGTIPSGIKAATMELACYLWKKQFKLDGYGVEDEIIPSWGNMMRRIELMIHENKDTLHVQILKGVGINDRFYSD